MSDTGPTARSLFTQAVALPESEREAFVRASAVPDTVKQEVLRLLQFHGVKDDSFLEPAQISPLVQSSQRVGEYDIISRIAAGGMGVVFLGRDTRLNRRVAIKVLPPYLNDLPEARNRLIHEAKVAAKLQHEGIVPVFDVVITDTVVAVVSQYIEGNTLESLLRTSQGDTAFNPQEAVQLVRSVACALQHAHQAGVIHRDLKPSNILIESESQNPKITDFGIAKVLTQTEVLHTSAGAGTCYYMSPEQTRESSDAVGPPSDIFSLGIVLYQLLTGKRPFDGPTRDSIIESIRNGDVVRPRVVSSVLSRDIELVCLKMLEVDPSYRYQTCDELVDDLDRYIDGRPVLASPPSLARQAREILVTRRQLLVRAGLLGMGVSGGAWVATRLLDTRATLNISTGSSQARIHLSRWIPSEFRFEHTGLGSGRQHRSRLDAGMYRIAVEYPQSLREFDRYIDAQNVSVESVPMNESEVLADMVHVDPLSSTTQPSSAEASFNDLVQHVKPFLIDRFEVSNGMYREFVTATGHQPPPIWPQPYDRSWDDLPVCMVTGADALAYAEWRGKRLPTYPEWQLMARGLAAAFYPWGNERPASDPSLDRLDQASSLGNWGKRDMRPKMTQEVSDEIREHYLQNVWPVGQFSLDHRIWPVPQSSSAPNPGTIQNLLGNVSEWTSTPFSWRDTNGDLVVNYQGRYICGQPWAEPGGWTSALDLTAYATDVIDQFTLGRGFRCARSIL